METPPGVTDKAEKGRSGRGGGRENKTPSEMKANEKV